MGDHAPEKLVTLNELAKRVLMHPAFLRRLCKAGLIEAVKVNGADRYDPDRVATVLFDIAGLRPGESRPVELLSASDMARSLHRTPKWVRAQVRAGKVPAFQCGGRLLFHRDVVHNYVFARYYMDLSPFTKEFYKRGRGWPHWIPCEIDEKKGGAQ